MDVLLGPLTILYFSASRLLYLSGKPQTLSGERHNQPPQSRSVIAIYRKRFLQLYHGKFLCSWDHNSFIVGTESQRGWKRDNLSPLNESKKIETKGKEGRKTYKRMMHGHLKTKFRVKCLDKKIQTKK